VVLTAWFPKLMLLALSEAVCACSKGLAQKARAARIL
jgi:hypothetical protein